MWRVIMHECFAIYVYTLYIYVYTLCFLFCLLPSGGNAENVTRDYTSMFKNAQLHTSADYDHFFFFGPQVAILKMWREIMR